MPFSGTGTRLGIVPKLARVPLDVQTIHPSLQPTVSVPTYCGYVLVRSINTGCTHNLEGLQKTGQKWPSVGFEPTRVFHQCDKSTV